MFFTGDGVYGREIFQNVYLFNDTIRNNICFEKPDATEQEMIAAAKKHVVMNLVVDDGRIVQKGTHKELICEKGRYLDFIKVREEAEGWQMK